jgi:succinate dehydrogenase / fumarate reductase iron-sulfur subunit
MAATTPNLPEPYRAPAPVEFEFHVSELASENAGAMSPFGDDIEFPLPFESLGYRHPGPADRPNLIGD